MVAIIGKYLHERNENIDEYFKAVGVPYLARKMMSVTHPRLEISQEGDQWTIKNITMMTTLECTFTLGCDYEETMPNGTKLKSVTTLEGDSLVTVSRTPDGNKLERTYDFSDEEVVVVGENGDRLRRFVFLALALYADVAVTGCRMTKPCVFLFQSMSQKKSDQVAKRYFKRIQE